MRVRNSVRKPCALKRFEKYAKVWNESLEKEQGEDRPSVRAAVTKYKQTTERKDSNSTQFN